METKDWLLVLGVVVTLVLGIANLIYNFKTSRRTAFINTVTSERVKWIGQVREGISNLCALCDQWIEFKTQENTPDLQRRIEQLRTAIRLQFHPTDDDDEHILRLLDRLPSFRRLVTLEEYQPLQDELIAATQKRLKIEWEKVNDESMRGDLRPREK